MKIKLFLLLTVALSAVIAGSVILAAQEKDADPKKLNVNLAALDELLKIQGLSEAQLAKIRDLIEAGPGPEKDQEWRPRKRNVLRRESGTVPTTTTSP